MISCPLASRGWSCKSTFHVKAHLVDHLVMSHNATDVADRLVQILFDLYRVQDELEKQTFVKAEENKSEGAIP